MSARICTAGLKVITHGSAALTRYVSNPKCGRSEESEIEGCSYKIKALPGPQTTTPRVSSSLADARQLTAGWQPPLLRVAAAAIKNKQTSKNNKTQCANCHLTFFFFLFGIMTG